MGDFSKKKKAIYTFAVIWLVFAFVGCGYWLKKARRVFRMETYEECVANGYPVLEGIPDRCKGPGEKYFKAELLPFELAPRLESGEKSQ